ncbi:MAG TPA: chloride channel protein [Ilumatobacteraceae bacterium]|nr:chloride channel protein [Ilumatobacteraceae bacterium]
MRRGAAALVVGVAAACFAAAFRRSAFWVTEHVAGSSDPTVAASNLAVAERLAIIGGALVLAWLLARTSMRLARNRLGLAQLAAAARGEGAAPSLGCTLLHSGSTWIATAGMLSIGRESAIIETGGAIGAAVAGSDAPRRPSLIAAGVAAAFAAAYHAPLSAVVYVEGHIGIRDSRRSLIYGLIGAASGYTTAELALGGEAVLPGLERLDGSVVGFAALGVVPAIVASLLFRWLRERFPRVDSGGIARAHWVAAALAVGLVGAFPKATGNGLEALRSAATSPTMQLVLAMVVVKMIATVATLRSGVPGGVFSPSLAVGAGAAMAALLVCGVSPSRAGELWGAALVAMAAAITISLRSPLLGALVVAELCGDPKVLPLTIVAAVVASVADHGFVAAAKRLAGKGVPAVVDDADG